MPPLAAVSSVLGGVALGALYFGLLWLTLQRLPEAKHPALLAGVSLVVRAILIAGGLFLLMQGEWLRVVFALAGVVAARTFMIGRIRPSAEEASWN